MPFPASWPPRVSSGIRSIRFFAEGTATANFDDSAFMFLDGPGANPMSPGPFVPPGSNAPVVNPLTPTGTGTTQAPVIAPMLWAGNIRVCVDAGPPLEFSFDGINVHGKVLAGEQLSYRNRYEAGICVRGAGSVFRIEAW
jgi:hypothetical protein